MARKSATDYANQALRLQWLAATSNNPERRRNADNYARAAMKASDDIIRTRGYQKAMGKAQGLFKQGTSASIKEGNRIERNADNKKYSNSKRAVEARARRAQGLNGG